MRVLGLCLLTTLLLGQALGFTGTKRAFEKIQGALKVARSQHKAASPLKRALSNASNAIKKSTKTLKKKAKRQEEEEEGRVSFRECNLSLGEREDCGYFGITEYECYSRGCCWGQTQENEVPWCYHSIPTMLPQCMADVTTRVECGFYGIRKETCMAQGCCWRPTSVSEAPWCFHKERLPIHEGECGVPAISPSVAIRIVGGVDATAHSWPWMVSLRVDGDHFCGGSLVNNQWVVSAAHCAPAFDWGYTKSVVVGNHMNSEKETYEAEIEIVEVIPHEDYGANNGMDSDIMLLKLAEPVEFNEGVSPVCLPTGNDYTPGHYCYTTGWGNTQWGGMMPDALQQVMVHTIDRDVCNGDDWYGGQIDQTMVCAGYEEGGRDSCQGDSGGPLVCFNHENEAWELTGVVSWGEGCAFERRPGIYSNVADLYDWVEETISANS